MTGTADAGAAAGSRRSPRWHPGAIDELARSLRDAGVTVIEGTLRYRDFENADEIFSTGNFSKVVPVVRIGERSLQPGPFYRKARAAYWDFAHG